jgi:hypothetical protein
VAVDVGESDRRTRRTYAEIGAEIRQLQRSQGPRLAPPVGSFRRTLRLDSSRVNAANTLFGSLDTSFGRARHSLSQEAAAELDTLSSLLASIATHARDGPADSAAALLARVSKRSSDARLALRCSDVSGIPTCPGDAGDLAVSLDAVHDRALSAMLDASGVVVDAVAGRELVAAGDSVTVALTVFNGGGVPISVRRLAASAGNVLAIVLRDTSVAVLADSAAHWAANLHVLSPSYHWWQVNGLVSGTMIHVVPASRGSSLAPQLIEGEDRILTSRVEATIAIGGVDVPLLVRPIVYRDPRTLRSDARRPLEGVPETSILFDYSAEYERAGLPFDRLLRVYVWSARSTPDSLEVTLQLPGGLHPDSTKRVVVLPPFGARDVYFHVRGVLHTGSDTLHASARSIMRPAESSPMVSSSAPRPVTLGVITHEYAHIPVLQFVRFATDRIEAVDLRVPAHLDVAYVKGTEDLTTAFRQLRIKALALEPSLLSVYDLSTLTTVLIGADALTKDALVGAVPALQTFARAGGTVVVLAGRRMARSGLMPYPIAFDTLPFRVTDPLAPVHLIDAKAQVLAWPNAITNKDFDDWINDRAHDVPVAFDPRYRTFLSTGDPKQPETMATILSARVGKGIIIYTSLSIDDQIAATNPGAARLLVNLLSAGLSPAKEK